MIPRFLLRSRSHRAPTLWSLPSRSASNAPFFEFYTKAADEFRLGNLDLAADFNRKAIQAADAAKSEVNWRDVAAVRLNLAHILKLQSDFSQALESAESALKDLDAHFSSNKQEVCFALDVMSELCCEIGEVSRGLEYINRAIELKTRIGGVDALGLARSYNIRGALFLTENKIGESRSDFIRGLGINVLHHGKERPLHLSIGITLSNIGGVLRKESGRIIECEALYRDVVSSFENSMNAPGESWMVGQALSDLAEALIEQGTKSSLEEAKSHLARALHIFLSTRGMQHPSTNRATALLRACAQSDPKDETPSSSPDFVNTLLSESEKVIPRKELRISGDILFLDRRGHVGHGHPHTPLFQ